MITGFWLLFIACLFVLVYNAIKLVYLIWIAYSNVYFDDSELSPDKVLGDDVDK